MFSIMAGMKHGAALGVLALLIIFSVSSARYFQRQAQPLPTPSPIPSPSGSLFGLVSHEETLSSITVNSLTYRYQWQMVDVATVSIGLNKDLASTSSDLMTESNCSLLTSGGFYGKNSKPIGLFVSDTREASAWQENQLFNGIIGYDGTDLVIDRTPAHEFDWAIQSGPVLWRDQQPVKLSLTRDQEARRIIAGVTMDNQLLMMVVVAEDSLFKGPTLTQLPAILTAIVTKDTAIHLKDAINLDGGTASAYQTPTLQLKELQPIGSYICIKNN